MRVLAFLKSRVAALSGGVLCLALLSGILATPIALLFGAQMREMEEMAAQIGMYRARLAQLPDVEAQRAQLLQHADSEPGLIQAGDASLAAAELQRLVETLIQNHGGELRSTQPSPPEQIEGFEIVAVENAFSLPVTQFANLLYALETQNPYLFIDRLEVSGPPNWQSEVDNGQEPRLQLQWTVHGYRRGTS